MLSAEQNQLLTQVGPGTQEQFVPQMVNFELLGGVNFKKGCYPGQEIVARSQYLGKLKRRTALASIADAAAAPGAEVFSPADPEQRAPGADQPPLGAPRDEPDPAV